MGVKLLKNMLKSGFIELSISEAMVESLLEKEMRGVSAAEMVKGLRALAALPEV